MNTHYPKAMIFIHWLVVILVIAAYLTAGNPVRNGIEGQIHTGCGIMIAAIFLIRLVIRLWFKAKIPKHSLPNWQHYLASITHIMLYLCIIFIPITGFMALSDNAIQYEILGIELPLFSEIPIWDWDLSVGELHELLGNGFVGLAGIHALAALAHHFILKDNVLKSMSLHHIFGNTNT
ncbi:cytochrome b [Ursidibacter arcticus]